MSADLTSRITSAHRRLVDPCEYGTSTDCTRAVYAILVDVYGPDVRLHRADLHIWDATRPWSNIEALVVAGLGVECVEGQPIAGHWHVVQGWRRLPTAGDPGSGHTLLYAHPATTAAGRVVEANVRRPWDRAETWGEVRGRYPAGVRCVALREP